MDRHDQHLGQVWVQRELCHPSSQASQQTLIIQGTVKRYSSGKFIDMSMAAMGMKIISYTGCKQNADLNHTLLVASVVKIHH